MNEHADRLIEIAQRLDELAEDGPSELVALGEELGRIAVAWPEPQPPQVRADAPEWLMEIQKIVERHSERIMAHRYRNSADPRTPYLTVNLPNPAYYYSAGLHDPKAFAQISGA